MLEGNILTHPCVLFLFTHPCILFLFLLLFLWRGEPSHPTYCPCFCLFEGRNYLDLIVLSLFLWREITVSTLLFRYCVTFPLDGEKCLNPTVPVTVSLLILNGRIVSPCAVSRYCSFGGEKLSQPYTVSRYCSWRGELSHPVLFPVTVPSFLFLMGRIVSPCAVPLVFVRPRAPSWPCESAY